MHFFDLFRSKRKEPNAMTNGDEVLNSEQPLPPRPESIPLAGDLEPVQKPELGSVIPEPEPPPAPAEKPPRPPASPVHRGGPRGRKRRS